jgi:hypothetical protein
MELVPYNDSHERMHKAFYRVREGEARLDEHCSSPRRSAITVYLAFPCAEMRRDVLVSLLQ